MMTLMKRELTRMKSKDNILNKKFRVIYLDKKDKENFAEVFATCEKEARDYVINNYDNIHRIIHVK